MPSVPSTSLNWNVRAPQGYAIQSKIKGTDTWYTMEDNLALVDLNVIWRQYVDKDDKPYNPNKEYRAILVEYFVTIRRVSDA